MMRVEEGDNSVIWSSFHDIYITLVVIYSSAIEMLSMCLLDYGTAVS